MDDIFVSTLVRHFHLVAPRYSMLQDSLFRDLAVVSRRLFDSTNRRVYLTVSRTGSPTIRIRVHYSRSAIESIQNAVISYRRQRRLHLLNTRPTIKKIAFCGYTAIRIGERARSSRFVRHISHSTVRQERYAKGPSKFGFQRQRVHQIPFTPYLKTVLTDARRSVAIERSSTLQHYLADHSPSEARAPEHARFRYDFDLVPGSLASLALKDLYSRQRVIIKPLVPDPPGTCRAPIYGDLFTDITPHAPRDFRTDKKHTLQTYKNGTGAIIPKGSRSTDCSDVSPLDAWNSIFDVQLALSLDKARGIPDPIKKKPVAKPPPPKDRLSYKDWLAYRSVNQSFLKDCLSYRDWLDSRNVVTE
jgi:hypothetical protein